MIGLYDCDTNEVHYRDYNEMPGHIVGKTVKCHSFSNNCDVWVEFELKDKQAHIIQVYPEKPVEPRSPWQDIWDLFYLQNERRSSHELKVWLEKTYNKPTIK
jgi:hypothetical protein